MKKNILSILLFLQLAINAYAGNYKAGIGGRLEAGKDGNHGLTYKYFLSEHNAFEGLVLSDFSHGLEFTALYEYHNKLPEVPEKLQWYLGGGPHIGVWEYKKGRGRAKEEDTETVIGIDGIIGIEYTFAQIPLNIAFDWHPVYNIITEQDDKFWPIKFGLTARYVFK